MEMKTKKRVTDESWDYTLTVKVGHDHFGRPLLSCDTWPPTQAEAGVVRQKRHFYQK